MKIKRELCRGCKMCARYCKLGAITMEDGIAVISDKCVDCKLCLVACTFGAIEEE